MTTLELLISGYFHNVETLLSNQLIPASINQICFQFLQLTFKWWFLKFERNIDIWKMYNDQDQIALDEAIEDNDNECIVGYDQKTVIFTDKFNGTEYAMGDNKYSDNTYGGIEVVNGSAQSYATIIIDNGSGFIKSGFAGMIPNDMHIPTIFPSVVARSININNKKYEIGYNALINNTLKTNKPIQHGIVTNWDDMEAIWEHIFERELMVDPSEHPVLLTEAPVTPKANREKMTEIMFEKFNVYAFYVATDVVLSLYSTGQRSLVYSTGLLVNCGYDSCNIIPIYEGYAIPNAAFQLNLGGLHIDDYLFKLYNQKNPKHTTSSVNILNIKEKLCYIAHDINQEKQKKIEKYYQLPDGKTIKLHDELFCAPEILFNPSLVSSFKEGIHQLVVKAISESGDHNEQREFYRNIVICGGSSSFKGLTNRLQKEITNLAPQNVRIMPKINSTKYKNCALIGGSMLATSSYFGEQWVTKNEYDDKGVGIVHDMLT